MRSKPYSAFVFFCFTIIPGLLFASEPTKNESDCRTSFGDGVAFFRNHRFAEAEAKLAEYNKCNPDDPEGWLRRFHNKFLWIRSEQHAKFAPKLSKSQRNELVSYINIGLEKTRNKLGSPKGANADSVKKEIEFYHYLEASLILCRSGIESGSHSILGLAVSQIFHESATVPIKQALELASRSDYQGMRYIEGQVNYGGGTRGDFWQSVLNHYGVPTDREKGMSLLCESAASGDEHFADDAWLLVFKGLTDEEVKQEDRKKDESVCRLTLERSGITLAAADDLRVFVFDRLSAYPTNDLVEKYAKSHKREP